MYLESDSIKTLHLELTSHCNARCPQCARTNNPKLPLAHQTLDFIRRSFPQDIIEPLGHMYSCGNYGDPILNPETYEICRWFLDHGCSKVSLHSNGGVRNSTFWKDLAQSGVRVVFGIDGLEDTNHIYRVGVRWNKLMDNVETFISAGGFAEWAFLIFDHNEHQINTAKQLSVDLGFKNFKAKASSRFVGNKKVIPTNKNNHVRESRFSKEKHTQSYDQSVKEYGSFEKYLASTSIDCKTQNEKSLYVDFQGRVWPCCWSGHRYPRSEKYEDILPGIENIYGENFNNLHFHSLNTILTSPWFEQGLESSWTDEKQRLKICSLTCGKIYQPANQTVRI